jgi:micrococcal nuclease
MKLLVTVSLIAVFAAAGASARTLQGVVTHVTDGDTLWLQADDASSPPMKLRLQGIDAPERCQAWGAEASAALASRVLRRHVQVHTQAHDTYGRTIGRVTLAGEDIAAWMVLQGHAWSYRYRRSPGPYAAEEQQARAARRGLFADTKAVEPRTFRRVAGPCP